MEHQIVIFSIDQEHFGLNISAVESIIKVLTITKIPHSPRFVEGVTNLRGNVLPIVDLRKRLNLPLKEIDASSRIIVVTVGAMEVGMIVDGVSEVMTISDDLISPLPAIVSTTKSSFITGVAKVKDTLIILLDLSQVLSAREKTALKKISSVAT
jgi:purine-binding chemotaxis protein CheW